MERSEPIRSTLLSRVTASSCPWQPFTTSYSSNPLLLSLIHISPKGLKDTANQEELQEISWISTNFTAQWCLNVIVALELIRDDLPEEL